MIRFLKWLFTGDGHNHKWKIFSKENLYRGDKDIVGHEYILQCEKCGDIKSYRSLL